MKHTIFILLLCISFALLLTGCGKQPTTTPETSNSPETSAETPTPSATGAIPPTASPNVSEPPAVSEEDALLEAAQLRRNVMQLAESHLPENISVFHAEEAEDGCWKIWCFSAENGFRSVWTRTGAIISDGKNLHFSTGDPVNYPAWSAVQNYLLLNSDLTCGTKQLIENLGFDTGSAEYSETGSISTLIPFSDFQAAMLRIVTPELYEKSFSHIFSESEGKLHYQDVGASGMITLVDNVIEQEDGSWLVSMHSYSLDERRMDATARAVLETLPDGQLVVSQWEPLG